MKAFSSVGGGVKGAPTKLKGGVICWCSFREGCDVDIAVPSCNGKARITKLNGRGRENSPRNDCAGALTANVWETPPRQGCGRSGSAALPASVAKGQVPRHVYYHQL